MATGIGNLPFPGKVYNPFDVLTAEELNEDVANIESLADGSGIGDLAIPTTALAGGITPDKLSTGAAQSSTTSSNTSAAQTYTTVTNNPAVTVTIGANGLALVSLVAHIGNDNMNQSVYISVAVSGASTVAGTDNRAIRFQAYANNSRAGIGGTFLMTGLTPGSNTFTMQGRVTGNTGTYIERHISVVPL